MFASLQDRLSATFKTLRGKGRLSEADIDDTCADIRVALLLSLTVLLSVLGYYFVGVDEGMTSVFGHTMMIHEWVHDSRHLLGFPCH